ncbi:MAG: F0F1 ATP synthase subunit A [Lacipirellulaceae bacterium]
MAKHNPLAPEELFGHVQDATYFHVPRGWFGSDDHGRLELPQLLARAKGDGHAHSDGEAHADDAHGHVEYEGWQPKTGIAVLDKSLQPLDFVFTKFMALELVVALVCVAIFAWLAARVRGGAAPKGAIANLFESILVFIRDGIAKPNIGEEDADRFVPFLWTVFFFVLGCNLIGMVPWMGSPTAAFGVTAVLALLTFGIVVKVGIEKYGLGGFLKAQVPHMDLPKPIAVILVPMIFVIELMGFFLKHFVLSVRLLANMIAGHVVLAVLLGFIGVAAGWAGYAIVPASFLGAVALSLLEVFVACLQAYVFTFLSALFIGASVHPH